MLFERCAPRVHRWALLLGLRASEADDAVQDVLATVARRIQCCESDIVFTSWLYQITRRVVANARRGQWLRRILLLADGPVPPEGKASDATLELDLAVRRCLRSLPLRQAEVLVLAEIEGYTRREICELLAVPEGTVASRMRLARRAFLRCWARMTGTTTGELAWDEG
jgi:RNA polymerase sigma-70 factor (ECF subfamily)